jgi:hypothetical protein
MNSQGSREFFVAGTVGPAISLTPKAKAIVTPT